MKCAQAFLIAGFNPVGAAPKSVTPVYPVTPLYPVMPVYPVTPEYPVSANRFPNAGDTTNAIDVRMSAKCIGVERC
ncbi:hypothetical protein BJ138DRAFT_1157237 [Hygrophoropsis aurantiaca]|uniref:Uncharacterized protein n=1 Tax=Hygrophoropsis aurantiaca TaxID=72124 RepID=A0ACB8A5Z2_9AGAM|nr:hypothetical protein BJ138DRAFT_1157237 [Hygrophoropsis aurantiaca]